ncbi:Hsp20/alpha crystallin family protein [Cytobacillus spongiae]|uniref:Hsp20/alpha crystallin family protein n=1 Tax=Cytobacillus spongiae TaxID=2901381 RepID=UPI001F24C39D|nr:Hsp20/alpha crystallin family protein [Cytobacillus spongiae]UII54447.1 Hsp20/alpha crystallin family protein [Cytobacillus spongiae]
MDLEQLQKWVDLSQKYQQRNFWDHIFTIENSPDQDVNTSSHQAKSFFNKKETFPRSDMYEIDETLIIEFEVPGVNTTDLSVRIEDSAFIIEGKCETFKPKATYFLKERYNQRFEKRIALPVPIIEKDLSHFFKDGLFIIKAPIQKANPSESVVEIPLE